MQDFLMNNQFDYLKRDHNAAPFWADALGILNTDSNFISLVGQQTEYILVHNPILTTYYADMDGDGYGNPLDSILAVGQPLSYVLNNTDCNDLDSLEFPDQVWYTDADQDGFGNGIITIQCERPVHGFVQSELQAISGDCDDNQAFIYPGYRFFTFSENPGYSNTVISQQVGDSHTTFHFQVKYSDATGGFPGATFPRVMLDYEGNGVFTNPNDRTIILSEDDITDQNTVDGKTYSGSINALPIGSNWKTSVHMQPSACAENFGAFDYPDVLVLPDLEIFASDISFSVSNPPISSPLTIHAVVHNVSDFAATDFLVRIRDQYDTTLVFADIPVPVLAAHSSINLSWNLTTIVLPSWHPIEVIVDATHVINESNELDNSAIRPYINGNYNVPGSIGTTSHVSPSVAYALGSQYATLNGKAFYTGLAVPLADSGVAGATIQFTILETGATFTTHTNANGNYSYTFPRPTTAGVYHITGTCTDFTLSGNLSATFELIAPPVNTLCSLANLTTSILVSNEKVVQGDSITGNIIISNTGLTAAPASVVYMTHTQGLPTLPDSIIVPALLPTQLFNFPFSMQFDSIGFLSICAKADATELIEECSEQNNSCKLIQVVPPLPDIVITNGPGLQAYKCAISEVSITLRNYGGIETGPFQCKILTKKNGILIQTDIATIPNILSTLIHPTAQYNVTIPFTPSVTGVYTFEAEADYLNEVAELSDSNNTASYSTSILECKPNFYPLPCQSFTVNSTNNQYASGSSINGTVQIKNSGNAVYQGNLTVRFLISGGGTFDTTVYVNLSPNQGILVAALLQAPSTPGSSITVIVDPMNLIDEFNESDNEVSNNMCWEFEPVDLQNCGIDFWDEPRLKNQAASIYVGVRSNALYRADSLKVKFEVSGPGLSGTVNLGYGIIHPFFNTCGCPQIAYLPYSFIYPEVGTYQFIITVDPDNEFSECSESNNILIRSVNVYNQPDMRILSQHIAPSKLNPDPNESIQFNITYENIGAENINDEMKLHVWVDNALIDSIYPANGLMPYGNTTFSIPASWSSGVVGAHVIRAVIDADHQVNETNELNNEATRVVVVGEAANLYVQAFQSNTPAPAAGTSISIQTRIGNSGDKNCHANVELYYVDQQHDTIMFYTRQVEVDAHDSISFITNWIVAIPQTTIIAKIVNASELEYTYDDNQSTFQLGELVLLLRQQPACSSGNTMGSLHAHLIGGQPPYNFFWQNGLSGEIIQAAPGIYSIHATDNSGQSISGIANIDTCPDVILHLNFFLQGYYQSAGQMVTAISNQGKYSFPNDVDSVLVELRLDSIGYSLLDSYRGIVSTDGSMPCYFYNPQLLGKSCFIVIRHRNTVTTWSATPITLVAETLYDFSTSASKAFGNNQSDVSGNAVTWALYSGDLNQDENVDLIDGNILDFSTENYEFGYQFTDLNGDGNVDLLDNPVLEENISNFIFAEYP
jgi:hypothetical protein